MASRNSRSLYEQVVSVTHVYLGPSAERFIGRQVHHHLHKPPEDLTREDLDKLIDWIRIAVSLLTEDNEVVEEYIEQLKKLTNESPSPQKKAKVEN